MNFSDITDKIFAGGRIEEDEALKLLSISDEDVLLLCNTADKVRRRFCGDEIHICSIINAKSGRCSEDCKFCAQSIHYETGCETYPLIEAAQIREAAIEAKNIGVSHFCIVTSGAEVTDEDFEEICRVIKEIKSLGIEVDCSLGFITESRIQRLKEAGVARYNHNVESSGGYYGKICTTHSHSERVAVVQRISEAGIEACCGGIIGMGEEPRERVLMAFELRELEIGCIPINILNSRCGTPLERTESLPPLDIIKTIAVFRLILPEAVIKVAGGRETGLRDLQGLAFLAGANGFIIGNYLTTTGRPPKEDLRMAKDLGFSL